MRKIAANLLLSETGTFLKNSFLEIADDGTILSINDTNGNLREIAGLEFYNGVLCPGFVNTHCHIELSHLKGEVEAGTGLEHFVSQIVTKRDSTTEQIEQAIRKADMMMQKEGIVAVGDISNRADSFATKMTSPIYYHTFIEVFGMGEYGQANFCKAKDVYDTYNSQLPISIVPHAPYSTDPQLLHRIAQHAEQNGGIQSIHNQETAAENELFAYKTGSLFERFQKMGFSFDWHTANGKSSLENYIGRLASGVPVLFIHNSFSSCADLSLAIETLGAHNVFFALCPRSNNYIENTMPDISLFQQFPNNVTIGTDSLASNYSLSVLQELIALQKADPTVELETVLQWATINGAKALNCSDTIGSFTVGKQPGVNLLTGINLQQKKLTEASRVRVLV